MSQFSIESYGGGFIIAQYGEHLKPFGCMYHAADYNSRVQPLNLVPFASKEAAEERLKTLEKLYG